MSDNPFTLTFGQEPNMLISRGAVGDQIVESFTGRYAMTHTYLIEGIRGSGKTVLMTTIAKKLEKEKEWIVINLNSTRNLLEDLADGLEYSVRQFPDIFKQGMSVSVADFGFGVNGNGQPANVIGRIEDILRLLQKKEKRLLITIDEVALDDNMRIFASQFQIFLREDFPVFLIMTGLYENLNSIQNDPQLTFLLRCPKAQLQPLSISAVVREYQMAFDIDEDTAKTLAHTTKGYAFAFQVLGYFTYKDDHHDYRKVITKYRLYLDEFVYEKLWSELSAKDREVIICMAQTGFETVSEIRAHTGMDSNEFSKYRLRLIRKGLVDGSMRGRLVFVLPLFSEFVLNQLEYM